MKSLDLTEFPPTAEADWRQKIAADLASRGESTSLLWQPEPDVVLDAVATNSTLAQAREQWPNADVPSPDTPWTSVQYVPLRTDGNDDQRLRAALDRTDLVLVEYRTTAIGPVLQLAEDNNLSRDRIVIDGAAAEDWTGVGQPIDDVDVLSHDRLLRPWLPEENQERTIESGSAGDEAVTIDARDLRSAVDSVVIECGAISAAVDVHVRRSRQVRINIVSPIGSKIFLEMAKLTALRGLLHTRYGVGGNSVSVEAGEVPRFRIWAVAGILGSSADRREHQIRLTYAAVAGILGGANCLVTMPHSADPEDVALAANVPLILRHESDLARAMYTMADSYYVCTAAAKIAARASALRDRLKTAGGLDTAEARRILTETIGRYKSAVQP